MTDTIAMRPIGVIRSPFRATQGMPIQTVAAAGIEGELEVFEAFAEGLRDIEGFEYLILLTHLHQAVEKLEVVPFMDTASHGVFATRAPARPNRIGLSIVRLLAVQGRVLRFAGNDMLDGTPVLDIKPYIPFVESVPDAWNRIAEQPPALLPVDWQPAALASAREHARRLQEPLVELIEQCLAQDPKPAYQQPEPSRQYGARLHDVNVVWCYPEAGRVLVLLVE